MARSRKGVGAGSLTPLLPPLSRSRYGPLLAGCVQLDVAAVEGPLRAVAVRQAEREVVVASGLAVVGHIDLVRKSPLAVYLGRALDVPGHGVRHAVGGHAGALHLRAIRAVIVVDQMAPERALLEPARDAKVRLGPGRGDPAAPRHEVAAAAAGR